MNNTGKTLVIDSGPGEVRVALLEDRVPVEIHIERAGERGVVGNLYRGRVVRVLPGMQAAFVELGLERTAFLYVNDALLDEPPAPPADNKESGEANGADDSTGEEEKERAAAPRYRRGAPLADIAQVLKAGQEILVQVQKEPLGTKGARLTRHIALPGRHLVFMPFTAHLGVSHRIEDPAERERLRAAMAEVTPAGCGFIVRTAAEGVEAAGLHREASSLVRLWEDIAARGAAGPCPRLVFEDLDLVLRTTRDLLTDAVEHIVIDSAAHAERLREFLRSFATGDEEKVEVFEGSEPIFDHYGIEVELERALERRVWLKSGGYIVIDEAEALTVVDVNSGRFVGKSSLEETITQINLEAVKETAYQLRLRNIGGIIIIDFIDMAEGVNREKVLAVLEETLKRDKAKTTIVRMSELGLVEMTRKRVRESLGALLTDACPRCKGRGTVKSPQTIANEILRAVRRALRRGPAGQLEARVAPTMFEFLCENEGWHIEELGRQYDTNIVPVAVAGFRGEEFQIVRRDG